MNKQIKGKYSYFFPIVSVLDELDMDVDELPVNSSANEDVNTQNNINTSSETPETYEIPAGQLPSGPESSSDSFPTRPVRPNAFSDFTSISAEELQAEIVKKYENEILKLNLMLRDQTRMWQHEKNEIKKNNEELKKQTEDLKTKNIQLKFSLKEEQQKRVKVEKQLEKIEKKYKKILDTFKRSPFLENLLINISKDKNHRWSPESIKSAVQLRFARKHSHTIFFFVLKKMH